MLDELESKVTQNTTTFKDKIKFVIMLNGKKINRDIVTKKLNSVLLDNVEVLQFGFFLTTYAAKITNLDELYIIENKNDLIEFKTENILHRINECVNDTAIRIGNPELPYNKMVLLGIANMFFGTRYKLEHEIPEKIILNTKQLLQRIGESWKMVFTNRIWSDLVITAINRTDKEWVLVNDFRFQEEYEALANSTIHKIITVEIVDTAGPINRQEPYHISEVALEQFPFDYIINYTIPYKNLITDYISPQLEAIIDDIVYNFASEYVYENQ
jgi:hypothetical protein